MQTEDIKLLLEQAIETTYIDVVSDGSHVKITAVSEEFDGLSSLKRQQKIYACLNESIASGAIHAVHIKTYTPAQWADQGA